MFGTLITRKKRIIRQIMEKNPSNPRNPCPKIQKIPRKIMCTMIVEKIKVDGSGKGTSGWFKLEHANISYDHPFNAQMEHALNIDFVNESIGPSARVAVELSEGAARELVKVILAVLDQADAGGHLNSSHPR